VNGRGLNLVDSEKAHMANLCENSDEPSGPIIGGEFLDKLSN
jgi:hypothetical protein